MKTILLILIFSSLTFLGCETSTSNNPSKNSGGTCVAYNCVPKTNPPYLAPKRCEDKATVGNYCDWHSTRVPKKCQGNAGSSTNYRACNRVLEDSECLCWEHN